MIPIPFTYALFTETVEFPIHMQYGYHDEALYLHLHEDFSELVIVLDGSAVHLVGEERYRISKGDIFVVGQGTVHGFAQTDHLSLCNIMFRPHVFDEVHDMKQLPGFQALFVLEPHYAQNDRFLSRLRLTGESFTRLEALLTGMMQEYEGRRQGWQDMIYAQFCGLCVMLSRSYRIGDGQEMLRLADAAAYIEYHFTEPIPMSLLAGMAGYSERQFLRLFREAYAVSPSQYITGLRIRRARQLLSNTSLSMGEVAARCGYDDQNYFSRMFRRQTGLTPTAFRSRRDAAD